MSIIPFLFYDMSEYKKGNTAHRHGIAIIFEIGCLFVRFEFIRRLFLLEDEQL